jgi:hypothetical protein
VTLPVIVRRYVERALGDAGRVPATVRVRQTGQMCTKPGAHPRPFTATEEFVVEHVAFQWRARFPLFGPLAMSVVDEYADGEGQLRVALLGIPLQTQKGRETAVGQAMPLPVRDRLGAARGRAQP